MKQISYYIINFESLTWTVEVFRTRFRCPSLLDFIRNLFSKKIWNMGEVCYEQWCYHFKFLEGVRLHWLTVPCRFWRDQIFKVTWCSQFKFMGFGNMKRVFRRLAHIQANIFFIKLKWILTKIDISWVKSSIECYTHPRASVWCKLCEGSI